MQSHIVLSFTLVAANCARKLRFHPALKLTVSLEHVFVLVTFQTLRTLVVVGRAFSSVPQHLSDRQFGIGERFV